MIQTKVAEKIKTQFTVINIFFLRKSYLLGGNVEKFGLRRDEVTGEWRRLDNEELNDLYCSPNIVRVIKSRRI